MLKRLEIQNYAIIDHLSVEFGPGFNILTGETGAGKSIIVGALGLLLGGRISVSQLRKGAQQGYVEGEFDFSHYRTNPTLQARTDGFSNQFTIKRTFSGTGGNKCFINNEQATVQTIKDLMSGLVDFHGQHQHQSLLNSENYYEILDRFGDTSKIAEEISELHTSIMSCVKEKRDLEKKADTISEMQDYLTFQLKEINEVNPQPGEEEELEQEWKILQNVEKIVSTAQACYRMLYDADGSAYEQIQQAQQSLESIREYDPQVHTLEQDLDTASVSVEEAAQFLQRMSDGIESNPERLEEINQRLMTLRQLQKKHKTSIEGLLKKKEEIVNDLKSESDTSEKINELAETIRKMLQDYSKASINLSHCRTKTAGNLQKKILGKLKALGMDTSLLDISVLRREKRNLSDGFLTVSDKGYVYSGDTHGIDEIFFRIATGKAEQLLPIADIASGGELSRLMLAIKSSLMQADHVPTLIFDEVDTGISGRIAAAVGNELHNLAHFHQILCITHLPQIAAKADHHYSVEKIERDTRIVTQVAHLDDDKRKLEIAKLLAGESVLDIHIRNAEEMIKNNA